MIANNSLHCSKAMQCDQLELVLGLKLSHFLCSALDSAIRYCDDNCASKCKK